MSKLRIIETDALYCDSVTEEVNLIVTDSPYFVLPNGKNKDKFTWDKFNNKEEFISFTKNWFNKYFKLLANDSFMFVFWSQKWFNEGINIFNPDRIIFWNYSNLITISSGDFVYDYEPIFIIKKGNPKLKKGKHSCILKYTKPQSNFKKDKAVYPTQKPLGIIKHILNLIDKETLICLDPFMGSGTTLVACKELGIDCIGIDNSKRAVEVTNDRLNNNGDKY